MDFRVKKLILEEGMKNIAKTEDVKMKLSFDEYKQEMTVEFTIYNPRSRSGRCVSHKCSYAAIDNPNVDAFYTIEHVRKEVREAKEAVNGGKRTNDDAILIATSAAVETMRAQAGDRAGLQLAKELLDGVYGSQRPLPTIKNVIFNYPATIVFWTDGDKTVVKCREGDMFNPEVGLALATLKKLHGNKGNYRKAFKPWVEKYETIHNAKTEKIAEQFYESICNAEIEKKEEAKASGKPEGYGICADCKHFDTLYFKEPCRSCLERTSFDGSSPNWEPKP